VAANLPSRVPITEGCGAAFEVTPWVKSAFCERLVPFPIRALQFYSLSAMGT